MPANFSEVDSDIRVGQFARALARLEGETRSLRHVDTPRFDAVRAELLYHTGRIGIASTVAARLLDESLPPELGARGAYIAAMSAFEGGNFADSLQHIRQSLRLAEASGDPNVLAIAQLGLLRLVADSGTALVPLLRDVRRVIARTGDPHLMVGLRLHYARVEASRHSPGESGRHLRAADALLQRFPNAWLQGRVHLGFCIVNTLSGDYQRAISEAELAIQCAASSGHARTELGGLINLSHAMQAIGRFEEAQEAIDRVLAKSRDDIEIMMAALDSRANLLIREGRLQEAETTVVEICRLVDLMPTDLRTRWVASTVSETRVRLLQAQEHWSVADEEVSKAIAASLKQRDTYWENRFLLLKLEGLAAVGKFAEAGQVLMRLDQCETVEQMGERNRVLGSAVMASGRTEQGRELLRRADRVATGTARDFVKESRAEGQGTGNVHSSILETPSVPPPDLDSAVALIELGATPTSSRARRWRSSTRRSAPGRPRLCRAAPGGPQIIDRRGWDDALALAAARKAAGLRGRSPRRAPRRALGAHRRSQAGTGAPLRAHRHPQTHWTRP